MKLFLKIVIIYSCLHQILSAQASIKPVCPNSIVGNFGNTFTVDIVVGDPVPVTDLFSASFTLTFTNTTYLTYNGIMAGNFLGGNPFIFEEPSSDRVSIAITSIPSVGPSSGSGVLVKVFFRIIGTVPTTTTNYFNIIKAFGYKQNGDTIRLLPQESMMTIQSATNVERENYIYSYELKQNFPNPFNPKTNITFTIPKETYIELSIYDLLGNLVKTLKSGNASAGEYFIEFDASEINLGSGVYLYQLKTPGFTSIKKMILIK